jgi:hypothetical protein
MGMCAGGNMLTHNKPIPVLQVCGFDMGLGMRTSCIRSTLSTKSTAPQDRFQNLSQGPFHRL